jgi:hypothetical protein
VKRIAVGVIVGVLLLAVASPASSATRLRVYKGKTSQGHGITFRVARTESGRVIREMGYGMTLTCEDQTTFGVGVGWGFGGNFLRITDGAFSFDDVFLSEATHIAGELGPFRGTGTMLVNWATLTDEEQPQLCTTGDLTWEVEFVRVVIRPGITAPDRTTHDVRLEPGASVARPS